MKNDLKNIYYGVSQKYKIDDKVGDITAGTPFVCLSFARSDTQKTFVNINQINEIVPDFDGTTIHVTNGEFTNVKETPAEILELIKNKYI